MATIKGGISILILLAAISYTALGTTYLIGPGGNDNNPGTNWSAPLAHVFQSIPKLKSGDTLLAMQSTYTDGVNGSSASCTASNVLIDLSNSVILVTSKVTSSGGNDCNWKLVGDNILVTNVWFSTSITGQSGVRANGFHGGFVQFDGSNDVVACGGLTNVASEMNGTTSSGDSVWAFIFQTDSRNCRLRYMAVSNMYDCDFMRIWGDGNIVEYIDYSHCYNSNYTADGIHADFIQNFSFDPASPARNITIRNCKLHDCMSWSPQLCNTECDGNTNFYDWRWENCVFSHMTNAMYTGIPATQLYNCTFDDVGSGNGFAVRFYQSDDAANGVRWSTNSAVLNTIFSRSYGVDLYNDGTQNHTLVPADVPQLYNFSGKSTNFVNAATEDYHLQSNSSLIAAGTNLSDFITIDFAGTNRNPNGPWDIGAFAYPNPYGVYITYPAANSLITNTLNVSVSTANDSDVAGILLWVDSPVVELDSSADSPANFSIDATRDTSISGGFLFTNNVPYSIHAAATFRSTGGSSNSASINILMKIQLQPFPQWLTKRYHDNRNYNW